MDATKQVKESIAYSLKLIADVEIKGDDYTRSNFVKAIMDSIEIMIVSTNRANKERAEILYKVLKL